MLIGPKGGLSCVPYCSMWVMHHSEALHVEMFWDPIFHIMKWAEGQSGLLNSVTL